MKNKLFFAGMAALALTFGLVMTGCDNGGGGGGGGSGGGGGINPKLVGKWGNGSTVAFEITAAGKYKASGGEYSIEETDANTITVAIPSMESTADWEVSNNGNTLTLRNGTGIFASGSVSLVYTKIQ
jgi:hypothetical protein